MDYSFKIIKSKRRTLSLEINDSLGITVRAPYGISVQEIERFISSHTSWIEKQLARRRATGVSNMRAELPADTAAALRARAKTLLAERVAYYSGIMGVCPTRIKITSAKTRFGSCGVKNNLCFSFRLMLYPEPAIDYVVVHELAHIKQRNHSRAFYGEIAKILPDYRERIKLLRNL